MKLSRKLLAVLLSALMLVSLFTTAMTVAAAQKETVIIAGSDFQVSNYSTDAINNILTAMQKDGIRPDKLFFGGDYSLEHSHATSTQGVTKLTTYFSSILDEKDMVFAQGNHDPDTTGGLAGWGNMDPAYGAYGLYIIEDPTLAQEWGSYDAASVTALQLYLENKVAIGFSKPIFIMNHFPLHWGYRTQKDGVGTNAYRFFNVINDAAAQGLNIIYLFGHNHSNGYDDSMGGSSIFLKKGDTIQVCQGSKKAYKEETLNFTYMNSGYTGYYTSPMETAEDTLTMSVFRIRGNEVIISRYSADGEYNLKSAGVENTSFTYDNMPAVNTTVYTGSYKIAADGTATSVATVRDMDDAGVFINDVTTSTTEANSTGNGLAFKFDVAAAGVTVEADGIQAIYPSGTVNVEGTAYTLVDMGAIVTNKANIGSDGSAFYRNAVDTVNNTVIDVRAQRLCNVEDSSASFAVRIIKIPDNQKDAAIYARPYYVFRNAAGDEITVYGDVVGASYNGKLSNNDGEMEW